ncbi:GAF and ANTAR domain-containing protein [Streptomyces sp. NBC_00647]|uniref:ANTAR domain-containing protein n=1 Tax=Streptomyces sp. NBC_00647 TaxID=2975796 RepID=UPI003254FA62
MSPTFHGHPTVPTLLDLADAPVREENCESVLQRLAEAAALLPGVESAACFLTDAEGTITHGAASDGIALQLNSVQADLTEGPGLDSCRTAKPLANVSMDHPHTRTRWPRFASHAAGVGVTAVTAVPMRYLDRNLGALNLYHRHRAQSTVDARAGRLLADAAAIGLSHRALLDDLRSRERQLRVALESRVIIEQAKGLLAERLNCTVDDAFDLLRHHARSHQVILADVARAVVHDPTEGPFPARRS